MARGDADILVILRYLSLRAVNIRMISLQASPIHQPHRWPKDIASRQTGPRELAFLPYCIRHSHWHENDGVQQGRRRAIYIDNIVGCGLKATTSGDDFSDEKWPEKTSHACNLMSADMVWWVTRFH